MLDASEYLLGAAEIAAVVGAAAIGAVAVRGRLLPGWTGPPAWLADSILAIALLLWVAELLGAVGLFEELPYVAGVVATGVGLRVGVWRPPARSAAATPLPPAPPVAPLLTAAGLAVAGLAVAHWSIGVRLALDTGITNFDSTWYHGPFAALFAQDGDTFALEFIAPQFLAWFYPANSELLHGAGIAIFERDILSPLLNAGWLVGTLLAAWCVGRPYGAGTYSLAGVTALLVSGSLADQAGSMRNDMPAIFFLLAAIAVAVNARGPGRDGPLPRGALAVAGLAAGLAAGVKLNYLPPAAALAVGLIVIAPPGARRRAAAWTGVPLLAGCGYWYLRNLVHSGNPLPWVESLGPLPLPGPDQELGGREQHAVLSYLFDGSIWADWFFPGLRDGLGALWPLLIGLAVLGLVACLLRGRDPLLRAAGIVGLVCVATWAAGPASASGPEGTPLGFESGLRYLAPGLVVGLALLPLGLGPRGRSPLLLVPLLAALAFADASGIPWYGGYVAGAAAVGAAAALAAALVGSGRLRGLPRPAAAAAAAGALVLAIGAGWAEQRRYLDRRYEDPRFAAPGLNAAFAWARELEDRRIATTATRQYPLFGTELSNRVEFVGEKRPQGGFVRIEDCRSWRAALNEGDYEYAVLTFDRVARGGPAFPPEAAWTRDPNSEILLRQAPTAIFRLRGPLPAAGCRPATRR